MQNIMQKITLLTLLFIGTWISSSFAQQNITFKDFYQFYPKSVYGINWMKEGSFYSSQEENDIVKYDVKTGEKVETILKGSDLNPQIKFEDYSFSADEQKMLLLTEKESIYRRSFKAFYYVYDLKTKKLAKLSEGGKQSYASFSPNGSKVAFVRENNLFMVDLADNSETQITKDGKFNEIINGSADWVYEEEFGFAPAFFWSPDGSKIAFYTFDESNVPEYNMQVWDNSKIYPVDYRFKYPKAGQTNSTVKISVYHVANQKIVAMKTGSETDVYFPRVNWTMDTNLLSIRKLNRLQNKMEIIHANATTGEGKVALTEEDPDGYVDVEYSDDLTYLKDGKHFIYSNETETGFKHLFLYTMEGKKVRQITSGNWEVAELLGIDENNKKTQIYYTSTEVSPLERHFYKIDLEGKKKEKLTTKTGVNRVNISRDFSYYILYHSDTNNPLNVSLFQTKKNQQIKVLEDNKQLAEAVKKYNFAQKKFFDFKTEDDVKLYGYMLKPTDFDASKKYPVLMYMYGGPASQNVLNSWGGSHYAWHQMLTQQGYIVVCVDNRGTNARGEKFKKSTYANLGKYEVQDQIATFKYLDKLEYVDNQRVGVWGWSYGGYMSSLCMTLGADYFKAGIAVAPVSNWRFYDSVYTERFLKRPQDNASGYDDYSPVTHADKLKGNYLLVHGTGDDNVHFQNAVEMQNALIKAGKQFQSFYYPNRNHGIYGGNTREHLYQMLNNFIINNL